MIALTLIAALIGVAAALYIAAPLASGAKRPAVALGAAGLIAVGAFALYLVGGSPQTPGQPHGAVVERLESADPATLSLEESEERLRAAVRRDPSDAEALAMLGRLLARTERELEAVAVLERSLRIAEDPRVLSDLGQALVNLNEGTVSAQAERAFAAAHQMDPDLPEPAFFLGVAAYQAGDRARAAELWGEILTRLEASNPFRQAIAARAADLLSRPSAGPGEGEAPFAAMAAEGADADAMVAAMLDRLSARLEDDPDDFSGWLTLIRARAATGDVDAARAALQNAAARFAEEDDKAIILAALVRALGLAPQGEDAPAPDTNEEEQG